MTTDLTERYGAPPRWRRPVIVTLTSIVAIVGLVWLGWVATFYGSPPVTSEVITFKVTSDHEMQARLDVRLKDGVSASCRLRAMAEDKTAVGEIAFTPVRGTNEVTIRTERRATSVEKIGCTADGQTRPR